ncbi:hypothetical protein ACIQU8_11800 [Streptomyces griseus]|uniref:hypothetical protein n=1 Tax=Streptomyces griseus TaxID=1911 RepID=UPI0037FB2AB6
MGVAKRPVDRAECGQEMERCAVLAHRSSPGQRRPPRLSVYKAAALMTNRPTIRLPPPTEMTPWAAVAGRARPCPRRDRLKVAEPVIFIEVPVTGLGLDKEGHLTSLKQQEV